MFKRVLKGWIPFVSGVLVVTFLMSLWQGEKVDWGFVITFSLAGLIGTFIGTVLRKASKKE
ncbi:hypothetical protein [Virgibacillus necropolis]|uniref:Uncharacterized protein n=1 Tax=Virgibacillus necropolis TaxID=163877 RepID=A0A221MFM0_9BACI|nr:hypothetical protein [Virgibacillus necropolis]ASN06431.1 hypothetical protein CFK40_16105 [Virgibacillus necropolis]